MLTLTNEIYFLKYKGLANPSKKLACQCLLNLHSPKILFLQDIMVYAKKTISTLKSFLPSWEFLIVDVSIRPRGIFIEWNTKCIFLSFAPSIRSRLVTEIFCRELEKFLLCIYVYMPFVEKQEYQSSFSSLLIIDSGNFILGGGSKFLLGSS